MTRSSVTILLAALTAGCSSMPDPFDWFESDNQAPPAELTEYEPTVNVTTLWSRNTGGGIEEQYLKLVPTVYRGRVFVADGDGRVHAMDAKTGAPVWTAETEAPLSAGPGVDDDLVLVGSRDARLIALEESDGSERWRVRISSEVLSVPTSRDGIAVAKSTDGQLYGLNASTGEVIWQYEHTLPVLTLRGSSSPVIDSGSVIAGFANGKLVSLTLSGGDPQWETLITPPRGRSELERIVDIDTDPVISDGVIHVGTYQGEVAAVSRDTGVVLWRRSMSSHAGLAADWRHVYVTDSDDRVWALDPRNGAAMWQQDKLLNRRLTAPAILDDYVLVGDLEGYVHWLSHENGAQLARTRVSGAAISSAPRVVDGIAYVFADDGTVAAIAPALPAESP